MRDFSNEKYKVFQKLWTEFDIFSVLCAICIAFWLVVHFLLYGVLDSTIQISWFSFVWMAFFYINILLKFNVLFGYEKASILMIILGCFFMIELDLTTSIKNSKNVQSIIGFVIVVLYIIMQFSDAMISEADYMVDCFLMVILISTYLLKLDQTKMVQKVRLVRIDTDSEAEVKRQPKSESWGSWTTKMIPYAIIIFSVKMSYFFDREKSMNFQTDPRLESMKLEL